LGLISVPHCFRGLDMRAAYKVIVWLIALGVVVQAASMV
jgi:hypothetical protein